MGCGWSCSCWLGWRWNCCCGSCGTVTKVSGMLMAAWLLAAGPATAAAAAGAGVSCVSAPGTGLGSILRSLVGGRGPELLPGVETRGRDTTWKKYLKD